MLAALAAPACGEPAATDSGPPDASDGTVTVDGTDGTDGTDGSEPAYTLFDGFQAFDAFGIGSETADLCQLTWLLSGRPAEAACPDCLWTFLVSGTYDEALSTPGVCPEPDGFTLTLAFDGTTLSYEYGGALVPWHTVDLWEPGTDPSLLASTTTERDGYRYETRIQAHVR